jgi:tripartite-type tricarboxylate transporter receptor subunit TctC
VDFQQVLQRQVWHTSMCRFVFLLLCLVLAGELAAQPSWPSKPVRLVVPYAPGGTADILGRLVAGKLGSVNAQSFYVENRPGAGGTAGSLAAARALADGHTFVISGIGSHVIGPALSNTGFQPLRDFSHIAMLGGPPTVLVIHQELPVRHLKDFLTYAAARERGVSWGSPGQGTHGHLIGELFAASVGLNNMVHIGYKGGAPAMLDLMGGHIQAAFVTYSSANAHIKSGKVRALAISSAQRRQDLSEVPTFAELGFAQLTAYTWFAFSGPSGMSQSLLEKLNLEIRQGLREADAQSVLASEGIEPYDFDVERTEQFFLTETIRWKRLIGGVSKSMGSLR